MDVKSDWQVGPHAADQMHTSWRGHTKGSCAIGYTNEHVTLMDERERCYRASAQKPQEKHKLRPDEFVFQHGYDNSSC